MTSNCEAKPTETGQNSNNEAFLNILREISGQLAEQFTKLSIVASENPNEVLSIQSKRSDTSRDQPRISPARANVDEEGRQDASDDVGGSNIEELRTPVAENASQSPSPEDFVFPQSSSKKSARSESTLARRGPKSLHSLRISSQWRDDYSHTPLRRFRRGLNRQGKPPNLTCLIKSLSAPDESELYEAALRVLLPGKPSNSEEASAIKRLDALRSTLGEFRHLPYDNRMIFPTYACGPGKEISHIEAAARTVEAFALSGIANDISIYDYNELFGCHRYTYSAHESTGHMRPMRPITPGSWSEAPWSRLIVWRGLSERAIANHLTAASKYLYPLHSIIVRNILGIHTHPGPRQGFACACDNSVTFQVKAFRLCSDEKHPSNAKHVGLLHDQENRLAFEAYSLHASADKDFLSKEDIILRPPDPYYTALLLVPPTYPAHDSFNCTDVTRYSTCMQIHVLEIVRTIVGCILQQWIHIQEYMETRFGDGNALDLLQHDRHDQLLFDDATFSRSRHYFWAISALEAFEASIADTVEQWDILRIGFAEPFVRWCEEHPGEYRTTRPGMSCMPFDPQDLVNHIQRLGEGISLTAQDFKTLRLKIEGLRASLFSASAVIETCAATQLGIHLKLLTYVSVFYLPLSFCATLWNINGMPGLGIFALATVIVTTITYLAVFNLENIVERGRASYEWYKKKMVRSMKSDQDPKWRARAKKFEYFQPQRTRPGPTNWLLPIYSIRKLAVTLLHRRAERPEGQTDPGAGPSTITSTKARDPKDIKDLGASASSRNREISLRSLLTWASNVRQKSDIANAASASDGSRTWWFSRKLKKATSHPKDLP